MDDGSDPLIGGKGGNGDSGAQGANGANGANGATDHPLTGGAGRGRPAGMAILDPELHLPLQEVEGTGAPVRGTAEAGPGGDIAARVRRHTLRRLMLADVIGLAFAAYLGPLLLSVLAHGPDLPAGRSSRIYIIDLAMIPVFLAVFAVYGLYRGTTRRISTSVFSDLRNIVHALMISGLVYAAVAYSALRALSLEADQVTAGTIVTMCVVAVVTVPLARVVSFGLLGRASDGSVPVIVVGTGKLAQTVASHLRAHSTVQFVGFVDDNPLGSRRCDRRARRAARAVPQVPGGPGGGVLLEDASRADHRDAQDPDRPGGGVHRPAVLRADHRPVPCRGPLGPSHAGHRAGIAQCRVPLPQAHLRHRRCPR